MFDDLLAALIRHHTDADPAPYSFARTAEGRSGLVFRATTPDGSVYAVKIAARDARRRTWREYTVTHAIHATGVADVCPRPLAHFIDVADLPGDVLISTWLDGDSFDTAPPPSDHATWEAIVRALARFHTITPADAPSVPDAVFAVSAPSDLLSVLHQRLERLPDGTHGALSRTDVADLVHTVTERVPHTWPEPPPRHLCHGDCHAANLIAHDGAIRLVDWENAGWSDSALDLSNLVTNWRAFGLPDAHVAWLFDAHAAATNDPTLPQRARTYRAIQCAHWVVMYTRFLSAPAAGPVSGTHTFTRDFHLEQQARYYTRAPELLSNI